MCPCYYGGLLRFSHVPLFLSLANNANILKGGSRTVVVVTSFSIAEDSGISKSENGNSIAQSLVAGLWPGG